MTIEHLAKEDSKVMINLQGITIDDKKYSWEEAFQLYEVDGFIDTEETFDKWIEREHLTLNINL